MRKIFLITILFVLALVAVSEAAFTRSKLLQMDQKLRQLVAPYADKVGICFIDIRTGMELQINGRKKFPAASVAKVPVMAAAFYLAEEGKVTLEAKIKYEERYRLGGSGVLQWMKPGKEYTLWNLIRLMIVLSDNTATRMIVDHIGMDKINAFLKEIGLLNTSIVDDTMLNEDPDPNINLTTPEDMARLMLMIKQGLIFGNSSGKDMLSFMKNQKYRWGIWRGVPPGVIVADKTGNVEKVLNDAGIVYCPAGNFILSIFTHGFEKQSEARKTINEITKTVYLIYDPSSKRLFEVKKARNYRVKPNNYRAKHKRYYRHKLN